MAIPPATNAAPGWQLAFALAAAGHLALGAAVLVQKGTPDKRIPDPVMVVELPTGMPAPAPAQPQAAPEQARAAAAQQQPLPRMVPPQFELPEVEAPLPPDPVAVAAPQPIARPDAQPAPPRTRPRQAAAPAAPAPAASNASAPSGDPRAERARDDWYALIFADLARKKRYPRESRRAGQEGTPTVRFTVNRRGRVSNISITRSSGFDLLDEATVELIRRSAPLPPMPRAMAQDSVTMSLPIEYSLDRD